jgi:hypothetical protein
MLKPGKKLWKMDELLRKTTGALMLDGMTCLPVFTNDKELKHFTDTLEKLDLVRRGFWATRKGT